MRHVLAVDLGTGGPKVALVAEDGTITAHTASSTSLHLEPGGGAEQDPLEWWAAITSCSRELMALTDVAVEAVAVTAQWSGTVPTAEDGTPVGRALVWLDSRGSAHVDEMVGGRVRVAGYSARRLARFLRLAGGLPGASGKDPAAHVAWLRHHRPDVVARTRWFLEPADWLNLQLTGCAVSSFDSIALHWVTDNRDLSSVAYDDVLLRWTGLSREQLPDLVPSASVVGDLLPEAAAALGVPTGIPVVTATGDLHSAVVGSGALADYEAHLYLGTSSWLSCHVPWKRTDVRRNQTTLPSALPGRYFVANEHETAGACLEWLRDRMVPEVPLAELDAVAATAAAGSSGVVFTPWLNGERSPVDDHTVRAGFHNLSLSTTRADVVRSVFEGVAFNGRWLHESVQAFVKRPLDSVNLIGGGAQSDVWCQIHADVLGVTVRQMEQPRLAGVRGAAMVAMLAMEWVTDVETMAARVPVAATYEPDRSTTSAYDRLYREFGEIYRRTRRIYRRLNTHDAGSMQP